MGADAAGPGRRHLETSRCAFINPAWTVLLSNKFLLVALWEMFPDHPLLLPAATTPDSLGDHVAKPIHARGGENVSVHRAVDGQIIQTERCEGTYGAYPTIYQQFVDTRLSDEPGQPHTSIGTWTVGPNGRFAGITIREDASAIIRNSSPIVPVSLARNQTGSVTGRP